MFYLGHSNDKSQNDRVGRVEDKWLFQDSSFLAKGPCALISWASVLLHSKGKGGDKPEWLWIFSKTVGKEQLWRS